ncbi:hypothetical protein [Pseudomonas sp. NBRC 111144]|uniref:hypothetical protein n=1 Tax=Pseudomonas sp. NBRC 111144 TaxID=1661059 RepID=UPI000B25BCFE|nr:hypothetical protein [Pseudomonas sp. NBRC 111144]
MWNIKALTKRQHYHMRAILKNFSYGEDLGIYYKDGRTGTLSYEDRAFYGYIAWSDETETRYGADIERRGLGQIRHVLANRNVSNHQHLSEYHIFWRLRHMFAVNPEPVTKIYDGFNFGTLEEVKDWANRHGKIYINGDGTIDGMFAATLRIQDGLARYRQEYEGVYWTVGIAENSDLISADCFARSLIFPISSNIVLCGKRKRNKQPWLLTSDDVQAVNARAMEECHSFCFGKPKSDDADAS